MPLVPCTGRVLEIVILLGSPLSSRPERADKSVGRGRTDGTILLGRAPSRELNSTPGSKTTRGIRAALVSL